jgi:hypothetical protein
MKKYRIKQVGGEFYPQYKNFFGWGYYQGNSYLDYGVMSFLTTEKDTIFYEKLYFESFDEANNFLNVKKKSETCMFHNIKE